ncbi:MAG: response regulator [Calditrichia bacterium]
MIVDDEYYLGQMLSKALMREQIEALAVTDIDSAIDSIEKKHFDLIVSDIYLPHKTGMDLFNYIKEKKVEVPIIFMTGNPNLEMAVNFLTQGGNDYIVKPFMLPDFIRKIKTIIDKHQLKREEKNLVKDLRATLSNRLSELRIYQDVFESTDDGLVITDMEGNIVRVNSGFEKITGMSSVQLVHQHLNVLQKSLLPELDFAVIENQLKKENSWHGELTGNRESDSSWYASITFSPIRNEESQVFAYAGLFKDVSGQRQVEQALINSLQQMNFAQEAIIFGLARLAEHRDSDTGFHLERIRNYCRLLAEQLMRRHMYPDVINGSFIQMLYRTAPLHDIGKVGIPDYILLKTEKLTEPEFEIMKSHTTIGFNTLNSILKQYGEMDFLKMGIEITHCHHERWDGTGYPQGLKEEEIPVSARILSIADVYDALTTERSYKEAYTHELTLDIMKKDHGKHFAPDILDVFIESSEMFDKIREHFSEHLNPGTGELPDFGIPQFMFRY